MDVVVLENMIGLCITFYQPKKPIRLPSGNRPVLKMGVFLELVLNETQNTVLWAQDRQAIEAPKQAAAKPPYFYLDTAALISPLCLFSY
jgi:hypothetical protein